MLPGLVCDSFWPGNHTDCIITSTYDVIYHIMYNLGFAKILDGRHFLYFWWWTYAAGELGNSNGCNHYLQTRHISHVVGKSIVSTFVDLRKWNKTRKFSPKLGTVGKPSKMWIYFYFAFSASVWFVIHSGYKIISLAL